MVQKSKGGKKCRSVVAGKKAKGEMKHNRKTNYKKKVVKKVECCVCMEEVPNTSDNTITCGKVNHHLCSECKIKCDTCPMCRSHKIKNPISQDMGIRVVHRKYTKVLSREKILVTGFVIDDLDSFNYIDIGNGIYEKINEDLEGYGVYKHEFRNLYIYRDFDNIWVLDDKYDPSSNYAYGEGKSKRLIGKNTWCLCGFDGQEWNSTTTFIKKIK